MAGDSGRQQRPPVDYAAASRTGMDQEYTYLAVGMVAGAIPGVIAGLLLSLAVGHAAMWVSIVGGVGIILGLAIASLMWRRRERRRDAQAAAATAPGDNDDDGRSPAAR